jgi:tetratricopeptide (TPR) repeat protein
LAYKALSKVIRANPPYEVAFNARIMQTEVMHKGKFRQMIARLKRMAKSDKNKDYLDKVYYAMGNIYLSNEDTTHCIYAWEKGLKESKKNGPDKATLLLHLSQLYWEQENYIDAARTYKQCVSALDKEHVEYKETERRSKVLGELEPHLSTIKLQDSLQVLAQSPEEVYLAAIDRVIAELLKKEKEEAKQAAANGTLNPNANNNAAAGGNAAGAAGKNTLATDLNSFGTQQQGDWYFYNPTTVRSGVQEFQKRWGMRPNEDFWRISNNRNCSEAWERMWKTTSTTKRQPTAFSAQPTARQPTASLPPTRLARILWQMILTNANTTLSKYLLPRSKWRSLTVCLEMLCTMQASLNKSNWRTSHWQSARW